MEESDLYSTFQNGFFQTACQDVSRIVSILSLDSTSITKPFNKKPLFTNLYERYVFFSRFFYMVFIKGFTPTIFDAIPYNLWKVITIAVYIYRLYLLPFWLRFTGYGKYTSWKDLGSKQPSSSDPSAQPLKVHHSLILEKKLSSMNFGDDKYEEFIVQLYKFTTHLSPHSQAPSNPFTFKNFSGNFFDHLVGVYKILLAWKQPQYVVRAGLFHSVYGTFDYRYSLYDLREGRDKLVRLIGCGAEEIAFAICTSDRLGF
jgi:hypothetical protein